MRVLVIGSGGREHALIWALKQTSASLVKLYCAPGNGGIAQLAECVNIATDNHSALMDFARANAIDLKIAGPSRAAARLEASKAFAKDFMRRHTIPTADYVIANSSKEALRAVRSG